MSFIKKNNNIYSLYKIAVFSLGILKINANTLPNPEEINCLLPIMKKTEAHKDLKNLSKGTYGEECLKEILDYIAQTNEQFSLFEKTRSSSDNGFDYIAVDEKNKIVIFCEAKSGVIETLFNSNIEKSSHNGILKKNFKLSKEILERIRYRTQQRMLRNKEIRTFSRRWCDEQINKFPQSKDKRSISEYIRNDYKFVRLLSLTLGKSEYQTGELCKTATYFSIVRDGNGEKISSFSDEKSKDCYINGKIILLRSERELEEKAAKNYLRSLFNPLQDQNVDIEELNEAFATSVMAAKDNEDESLSNKRKKMEHKPLEAKITDDSPSDSEGSLSVFDADLYKYEEVSSSSEKDTQRYNFRFPDDINALYEIARDDRNKDRRHAAFLKLQEKANSGFKTAQDKLDIFLRNGYRYSRMSNNEDEKLPMKRKILESKIPKTKLKRIDEFHLESEGSSSSEEDTQRRNFRLPDDINELYEIAKNNRNKDRRHAAFLELEKKANSDFKTAQDKLAVCLKKGYGCVVDVKRSKYIKKQASKRNKFY